MSLQPRPIRERIEGRISSLRESADKACTNAARSAGIVAIKSLLVAWGFTIDSPETVIVAGLAGTIATVAGVRSGFNAVAQNRAAAVLEGALAQHELDAGVPFDAQSQRSYFLPPVKPE